MVRHLDEAIKVISISKMLGSVIVFARQHAYSFTEKILSSLIGELGKSIRGTVSVQRRNVDLRQ